MKAHTKKQCHFAVLMTVLSSLAACGGKDGGVSKVARQADRVVASVAVTPNTWDAMRGQQQLLTATAYNAAGYAIPGVQFVWDSSATDVAQVDTNGNVTVLFVAGSADITATANGKIATTRLTVTPAVSSVVVSPETWAANRVGQRQRLTVTALDSLGDPISDVHFAWESSAIDVVQVDASGMLTAFSPGSAIVTATAEGQSVTSEQTVTSEIPSVNAGLMYTVWFARSDDAPALLVDGNLIVLQDLYCLQQDHIDWVVCPWDAVFGEFDYIERDVNDTRYPNFPNPPNPTTPWSYGSVAKFQWFGDRVGILSDMHQGQGTLRVLDRHEEWKTLSVGNVSDFQIDGARTGMIHDDGRFAVNVVGTRFTHVASGVQKFQLEGARIGVILENGDFQLGDFQEHSGIQGNLTTIASGVEQFQLEGDRIGLLFDDNTLSVTDGINGTFTEVASGVQLFQLERNRIGVLFNDDTLSVADGIGSAFTEIAAGVQQFQLERNRIGILLDDGTFSVTDDIGGALITEASDIEQMQLQGTFIGVVFVDGRFGIWDENRGHFRIANLGVGSADRVSQFRVVVDVPLPPERTTPTRYASRVAICGTQGAAREPGGCWPERSGWVPFSDHPGPSPYYGRFAGAKNPNSDTAFDWWWAVNPNRGGGPMDPFDALTMHHDAAYQCPCDGFPTPTVNWYPEQTVDGLDSTLCVVRYGLENARLTRNGRIVAAIEDSTRSDWAGLRDLYDTIYTDGVTNNLSYWTGTAAGCPDTLSRSGVATLTERTRAKYNYE